MSLLARHVTTPSPVAPPVNPTVDPPPNDLSAGDTAVTELPLAAQSIPTTVSAAWELELLIAGAVTFALFQLPSSLDSLRLWLEPRVTGAGMPAVIVVYMYAKVAVYTLLAAFVLNLVARAYWVGLVGLHSVYPRGVNWDRMTVGPAMGEMYRTRLASLPAVIARVDNFASVIFSFAFLIVVVCVFSLMGAAAAIGGAWALSTPSFGGRYALIVLEVVVVTLAIALALVGFVDKRYGPRWAPDSVAGRRLRRLVRIAARLNGTAVFGSIFFTLSTNLRRGLMVSIFYVAFVGGLLLAAGEYLVRLGAFATATPRYVPDVDEVRGVDAEYYESMRGRTASTRVPTIQSDIIQEPFVRLFVPYQSDRHDPALAASCAGARPLRAARVHLVLPNTDLAATGRLADTVLTCLARMHAVALDGVPQAGLRFRFFTRPSNGQKGMVAYLPTAALASGMHTLSIVPPPRAPSSRSRRPLVPYEITFWK